VKDGGKKVRGVNWGCYWAWRGDGVAGLRGGSIAAG